MSTMLLAAVTGATAIVLSPTAGADQATGPKQPPLKAPPPDLTMLTREHGAFPRVPAFAYAAALIRWYKSRLSALHVIVNGPAVNIVPSPAEILARAAVLPVDLIVMGTHGRGAVDLMVFGSNTHAVIRQAQCLVLTVRR